MPPLVDKWEAFGWEVIEVEGSNLNEIISSFEKAKKIIKKPVVIISYLIKGADISFMEHTSRYHGRAPNQKEYKQAIDEIEQIKKKIGAY